MYPTVFVICEHFSYEMIDSLIQIVRTSQRFDRETDLQRMSEALDMSISPRLCNMHLVYIRGEYA